MKERNVLIPLLIVSGIFSAKVTSYYNLVYGDLDLFFYSPGLFFGIALAVWFLILNHKLVDFTKAILWIGLSVFAYFLAFKSFSFTLDYLRTDNTLISFFVSGFVGSLILTLSTYSLFEKEFSIKKNVLTVVIGGVAGVLFGLIWGNPYISFIVWQLAVGLALTYNKNRSEFIKNNEKII
jgi:hypothetical protein